VSQARRSARRVALLGVVAFAVYGSWAAFANRGHGLDAALRALFVQGCSSAFVTSTVAGVIEWAHARLPRTRSSALLSVSFGVLFAAAFHTGLNLAVRTPEVLRTVTVPILASALYAGSYVTTLRALDRPRA